MILSVPVALNGDYSKFNTNVQGGMLMKQRENKEESIWQDYRNTDSRREQEIGNNNSPEIENPNPSTATPSIPIEMPVR